MAWTAHVASWKPPPPPPDNVRWITAEEANADPGAPILDDFVSGDLRKIVNHPHIFTGCRYGLSSWDQHDVFRVPNKSWMEMEDRDILGRYSDPGSSYFEVRRKEPRTYAYHSDESYWPCSVLRREQDGYYTVRIHPAPWAPESIPWYENDLPRLLTNYSREMMHYFVVPFDSDQHLPGAFRHPIGDIRDEIFPPQWKNIPKKS